MRHGWWGVTTSLGFHTDVGCCTYSAITRTPFSPWRTSGCFGVRCSVILAVMIWHAARIPVFLRDFVGDVTRGLLVSGADSLLPLSLGPHSSRVNSPSKKLCSFHKTLCVTKKPPGSKTNIALVLILWRPKRNHSGMFYLHAQYSPSSG